MKKIKSLFITILLLALLSIAVYAVHFAIFGDIEYIEKDLIAQLAFLPLLYIFYTIIIDNILENREKRENEKKTNMLIDVFFNELGTELIELLSQFTNDFTSIKESMQINLEWQEKQFSLMYNSIKDVEFDVDSRKGSLQELKNTLLLKRQSIVLMMKSENLLEHEIFSDLILAISHLCQELDFREDLTNLPDTDLKHLSGDIKRAYYLLLLQWVSHMKHLKKEYPYLYSLSVRTNPFADRRDAIIK